MRQDLFNSRDILKVGEKHFIIYRLDVLEKAGLTRLGMLPFSIRVLLEAALRQCNEKEITHADVENIAGWKPAGVRPGIPFLPARVIMQDFSGLPAVVDLAAMRTAIARLGGDPKAINPLLPAVIYLKAVGTSIQLYASHPSMTAIFPWRITWKSLVLYHQATWSTTSRIQN